MDTNPSSDRREQQKLIHAHDAEVKRENRRHLEQDDMDQQITESGVNPIKVKH